MIHDVAKYLSMSSIVFQTTSFAMAFVFRNKLHIRGSNYLIAGFGCMIARRVTAFLKLDDDSTEFAGQMLILLDKGLLPLAISIFLCVGLTKMVHDLQRRWEVRKPEDVA